MRNRLVRSLPMPSQVIADVQRVGQLAQAYDRWGWPNSWKQLRLFHGITTGFQARRLRAEMSARLAASGSVLTPPSCVSEIYERRLLTADLLS
jgi:hypothetical protein